MGTHYSFQSYGRYIKRSPQLQPVSKLCPFIIYASVKLYNKCVIPSGGVQAGANALIKHYAWQFTSVT